MPEGDSTNVCLLLNLGLKSASVPANMRAASERAGSDRYGGPAGASATINREPGQARKGAAAAVDLGAGVLLVGSPPDSRFAFPRAFSGSCILCDWLLIESGPCYGLARSQSQLIKNELPGFSQKMAPPDVSGHGWPGTCASGTGSCPGKPAPSSCLPVHRHPGSW